MAKGEAPHWGNPVARLSGPQGSFVEFSIAGYEFPNHRPKGDDDYDANWLLIQFRVSDGQRTWDTRDPTWLTRDIPGLAEWLRVVASGARPGSDWSALEPLLTLDCVVAGLRPRVLAHLALELRSDEVRTAVQTIELNPTPDELLRAADAVEAGLRIFPRR